MPAGFGAGSAALGGGALGRVVLVEGLSDSGAVHALAGRRGIDLGAEGIEVISMGGATNIGHYLERYGPHGLGVPVAGLCDAGEEPDFRRGLERAGLGTDLAVAGFFVCVADLEDELIRTLGVDAVLEVLAKRGELGSFRTFQKQPAHRETKSPGQLRRFLGTRSGRKIEYGRLLAEALDPDRVPRPLGDLLGFVLGRKDLRAFYHNGIGTPAEKFVRVIYAYQVSETVVLFVGDIAWPVTVLVISVIVLLTQREPIGDLIDRIRKLKIPGGGEAELAETSAKVLSSAVESLSRDVTVPPERGKRAVVGELIEPVQNREPIGDVEPLPIEQVSGLVALRAQADNFIEALAFPPPPGGFGAKADTLEILRHRGVLDDKQANDLRQLIEIADQAARGAVVPRRVAEAVRNSGPTILKQLDKLRAVAGPKFEDCVLLTLRQRLPVGWTLDIDSAVTREGKSDTDPAAGHARVDALVSTGDRRVVVEARARLRPGADGQIAAVRDWLALLPPELPVLIVMLGERLTERELSWICSGHEGPVELLLWDRDSAELILTLREMLERSAVTAGLPAQRTAG